MEIKFDERGNLQPYEVIEISLETFEEVFVNAYQVESTRHRLYENYKIYTSDLKEILEREFYQLIDGSFVTKKNSPKDIDLVTVIDCRDYESNKKILESKFASFSGRANYKVDAYIISKYPENHKSHIIFRSDLLYWWDLFGKTRMNRVKKQFKKGIIRINY